MFINNIDPVLLNLGPLEIRYYGLVYAIGFLIGYFVLRHFVRTRQIKLTEEQMDTYFIWVIVGSILMSRLFEVFIYNQVYYLKHLSEIFHIWNGGLSFHGGVFGAGIVTWIYARKHKIHFYDMADILLIPTTLVLAIGKLANYTNSELYGRATNVQWCVVFQRIDEICRHPVQIYEFVLYLAIFTALLTYYLYKPKRKKGDIFWIFIILYSIARFVIAFLREEPLYLGLNMGQWLSLATILIAIIILWKNKRTA